MKNRNFDKLRDLLRNNTELIELEGLLSDSDGLFRAFSDILREKFRELTPKELCEKNHSAKRIKDAALDILREHVRNAINQGDYYSAWKFDTCELSNTAQNDVLNEFKNINKFKSLSAFICHFTDDDNEATDLKGFLEFYNIPTFVDHKDASNFAGADWNKKIEKELQKRPVFIVLAVDKPPTEQVKKEIDLDEELKSGGRLRVNLILECLSDKSKELKIDLQKQYIKQYDLGEIKAYNHLIKSIFEKYKCGPTRENKGRS
jgi:hypothetical protein